MLLFFFAVLTVVSIDLCSAMCMEDIAFVIVIVAS
jgi:hypothetical protein